MADTKVLNEVCEKIMDEIKTANKKLENGKMTGGDVEYLDKLTHTAKSLKTIMAMEDAYSEGGYSRDNDYAYNRGTSYARGRTGNVRRDSMGRYSREGGYSYDDARADMVSELRELMNDAPDEQTKHEFRRFINKLESM